MSAIPRDRSPDSSLAFLSEGYTFISNRCRRYQSDIFETRLLLEKAYCMMGEEAAEVFYQVGRFTRQSAIPGSTLKLLQDEGSIQMLDGDAHRWRKSMFMSLMSPEKIQQLVDLTTDQWYARIEKWEMMDEVVLHDEVQEILCRAVCKWADVPLIDADAKQRTRELGAMIEGAGSVGPRNWKGRYLRRQNEKWIRGIIDKIRSQRLRITEGSPAHVIAWHRNQQGDLLDPQEATVELINILRPTVAVARFITFAALALYMYPEHRYKLMKDLDEYVGLFVQEVRRFYPFFPVVGGKVLEDFEWRGCRFPKGTWMLLDLYGTNHDPRIWEEPEQFRPERFRRWNGSTFNFIPQGGGEFNLNHRCPGEWITIELMKMAVRLLITRMHYEVPRQDLRINLSRMPAIPESRFIITNVRKNR